VQACFDTPFVIYEARQPVSACLGIVRLGTSNASGIEYLKDAFVALKRAKSQGLGSAVEFSQDIGLQVRERSHLLRDLGATMVTWCRPTASSRWQSSRA